MDAVELMNVGVNYMREHIVQEARVHYIVEDGGVQPNVVPPYARTWYYVRAPRRDLVDRYYARLLKMAEGADLMAETILLHHRFHREARPQGRRGVAVVAAAVARAPLDQGVPVGDGLIGDAGEGIELPHHPDDGFPGAVGRDEGAGHPGDAPLHREAVLL